MAVPVLNPVTVGTAVKYVGAAWNILSGGGGLNAEERRAIEAARAAGYTRRGGRVWVDPQGRGAGGTQGVIRAGRQIIAQGGSIADVPPPGARPADPGYRPDLTERRIPPLKRPPPPPPPPRTPRIPGRAGRIFEGIATVAGGTGLFEVIRGGIERVREREVPPPAPQPAPPRPPPGYASPIEVIGGRSPFYAPPGVKRPPPAPIPRPAAPAPRPAEPPIDTERLSPIDVYVPYAAIPAPPAPSPAPTAPSRTILGLTPAQLASIAVPTLLALLAGRTSGASGSRLRDPLTVPQTPLIPGLTPTFPGSGLTPGSYPLPFPGSGFGGSLGGGLGSTGTCECPPKRKRGPKKRRDVCYSGRYIERASGLSKTKLRKIPCR